MHPSNIWIFQRFLIEFEQKAQYFKKRAASFFTVVKKNWCMKIENINYKQTTYKKIGPSNARYFVTVKLMFFAPHISEYAYKMN
jgi:hypothetical protein